MKEYLKKGWVKAGLFVAVIGVTIFAFTDEGTNPTLINPYDVYDYTHRTRDMAQGSASTDSIVVHNNVTDYERRIAPFNTLVANYMASNISVNNNVSRSFGTSFQVSTTKWSTVKYTIRNQIALTLVVLAGSSNVALQTSPDNTTWTTVDECGYSDGVAVAVAITKTQTNNVVAEVPPGYYVRLVSTVSGGGTNSILRNQEKLY